MSETAIWTVLGILLVLSLAYNIYTRIRRQMRSPLGRVISIHGNIKKNEKLVDNIAFHSGMERLKTAAWTQNKDEMGFLPEGLRTMLSQTFQMCDEVNVKIDDARRLKSNSYMAGVDVSRLKEPLARSRKGIKDWVLENMHNPEYSPKRRRTLFDSLFGGSSR